MELDGLQQDQHPTVVTQAASASMVVISARHFARQRKILHPHTTRSPTLSSVKRVLFTDTPTRPVKVSGEKRKVQPTVTTDSEEELIFPYVTPRKSSRKRKQLSVLPSESSTSETSGKSLDYQKETEVKISAGKRLKHSNKRKKVESVPNERKARLSKTRSDEETSKVTTGSGSDPSTSDTTYETCRISSHPIHEKRTFAQSYKKAAVNMRGKRSKHDQNPQEVDINNNDVEVSTFRTGNQVGDVFNSSTIEFSNMEVVDEPQLTQKSKINKSRPVQEVVPWNVLVEEQDSGDCASQQPCSDQHSAAVTRTVEASSRSDSFTSCGTASAEQLDDAGHPIKGKQSVDLLSAEKLTHSHCIKSEAYEHEPSRTLAKKRTSKSPSHSEASAQSSGDLCVTVVNHRSGSKSPKHQNFNSENALQSPDTSSLVECKLTIQEIPCGDSEYFGKITRKTKGKDNKSSKLNAHLKNKTNFLRRESVTCDGGSRRSQEEKSSPEKIHRRNCKTTRVSVVLASSSPGSPTEIVQKRRSKETPGSHHDGLVLREATKILSTPDTKLRKAQRSSRKKGSLRRKKPACPRALRLLAPHLSEQYAQSIVPVVNARSKRTVNVRGKADTVLLSREDLDAFFILLEEDVVVRELLERDSCRLYADKYLLAMVFVYFLRAQLPLHKYDRLHFFAALYLAHDLEEDDDALKYEVVQWLVRDEAVQCLVANEWETNHSAVDLDEHQTRSSFAGSQQPKQVSSCGGCRPSQMMAKERRSCKTHCMRHLLLLMRDLLFWGMDCRAIVSKATCEKVMACEQQHWAWQRQRPSHHGDCVRHSHWAARRRGNLLRSATSDATCQLCGEAALQASSPTPTDKRAPASKGDKDSGYESLLVGSGGDHETIFSEMKQNFRAFNITHEGSPRPSTEETTHETSTTTSDEIFPSAPKNTPALDNHHHHHYRTTVKKTRRRLLLPVKSTELCVEVQSQDEAWTTTRNSQEINHNPWHPKADQNCHDKQRRKSDRNRVKTKHCNCQEKTISRTSEASHSSGASRSPQPTPRRPKLKLSDCRMKPKNLLPLLDHLHVDDFPKSKGRNTKGKSDTTGIKQNEGKNFYHVSQMFKQNFMLESVKKWFSHSSEIFTDEGQFSSSQNLLKASKEPWLNSKSVCLRSDLAVSRDPSTGSERLSQADTVILS